MSAAVETPVEVTVTRLAHGRDLPLPSYASAGSAGLDLYAAAGPVSLSHRAHAPWLRPGSCSRCLRASRVRSGRARALR